jgi:hypothetical protein
MATSIKNIQEDYTSKKVHCPLCRFEHESLQLLKDHMRLQHRGTLLLLDRYFGTDIINE